jgi:signal transduction histidine kinase
LDLPDTTSISEVREDLEAIQRQAQRASGIVEDFLDLSRRNGKAAVAVNINEIVERALYLLAESMRRSGIVVEARLDRTVPPVIGHPVGLERVLINLLTNAGDAMPNGGSVTISVDNHDALPGWLRVLVTDDGPGIPPEALGKIFNLFYTTKEGGSGLGLWLSRRIIREHNGEIEVQSELGKGTTFTIRLPTEYSALS